jgi:hypothetical protein
MLSQSEVQRLSEMIDELNRRLDAIEGRTDALHEGIARKQEAGAL